jgi:hypothetical protein
VEAYFDPARPLTLISEHHVRRALTELGIPDPRAAVSP